jgi:hypothetical protein
VSSKEVSSLWLPIMLDRFTPVNVRFVDKSRAAPSRASTERSTAWLRQPTNACDGFSLGCWQRKSAAGESCRWRRSPACTETRSPRAFENSNKNGVCPPVVCADAAPAANIWKPLARGPRGLAGAFARCHGRRSHHWPEVDAPLVAKTLQGSASSRGQTGPQHAGSAVASSAFFVAHLSQEKSRDSAPRPEPAISLPDLDQALLFGSKMARNQRRYEEKGMDRQLQKPRTLLEASAAAGVGS